ncbi:MAG: hypothetical protein QM808_04190 [Steroidobacteraceae bacterium]
MSKSPSPGSVTKDWFHVVGSTLRIAVGLGVLAASSAVAQAAAESNTNIPPNVSGPKNFEGVWWPSMDFGGPPPSGGQAPGGAPGGGPPAGGPPGGAPPGGGRAVELTGSTLQCAPIRRMSGSGGGMTTLIIQSAGQLVMVSEEDMDIARKVYMNVKHPEKVTPQPNGHSIGYWEGNTLVVDSVGYSDKDGSDSGLHIVERITKTGNALQSEATTTDKSGSVRKSTQKWTWRPDLQFNENVCEEGFDRYQVINGELDNPNIPPGRESNP